MQVLRWLLVIPGAVVAVFAVAFPVHWFVMINFGGCSQAPIIVINDPEELKSIEYFLQALLGPLAFAYAGARIAPAWRVGVSVILAAVVFLGPALFVFWIKSQPDRFAVSIQYGIVQCLANLAGSTAGVALTVRECRKLQPTPAGI